MLGRFGITHFVSGRAEHQYRELQVRRIVLYRENFNGFLSPWNVSGVTGVLVGDLNSTKYKNNNKYNQSHRAANHFAPSSSSAARLALSDVYEGPQKRRRVSSHEGPVYC
jgi:hypothetical protein